MEYSAEEYTEMLILYGEAGRSAFAAAALYAERYPERERHPSHHVILGCVQRARETGCLMPRHHGTPVHIPVRDEERVLRHFEENPGNSVRRELGLSRYVVHRILYTGTDCTRIIISECNNLLRETRNNASIFVKAILLFLFNSCANFKINMYTNNWRNIQSSLRSVGGMLLSPTISCGRTRQPSHQTACSIPIIFYRGIKRIRTSFDKARSNIGGQLMCGRNYGGSNRK